MNRILITALGSFSANAICQSLLSNNYYIVGTDIFPKTWQTNADLISNFYQIPLASDECYVEKLLDICIKERIDFVIPLTDPEVDAINLKRDRFEVAQITVCMASRNCVQTVRDKSKIQSNIPSYTHNDLELSHIYPVLAKPKKGRSREGQILLNSISHSKVIKNKHNYVFQKVVDGIVVTADVLRDSFGNVVTITRKELVRTSNGAGLVVEVFYDKILNDEVKHTVENFDVFGCINIEFILAEKDGVKIYYLMDINPRFSAGVCFSILSGYDFVKNNILAFRNEQIEEIGEIKTGVYKRRILP